MFDLKVFPETVGRTPRHWGVNVECQEFPDRINLWDWLSDSGATIVREFHPEIAMRLGAEGDPLPTSHRWALTGHEINDRWERLGTREEFDAFRADVRKDPEGTAIQWPRYVFDKPLQWLGTPDRILAKLNEIRVEPIVSMGYCTKMYPRPLVKDPAFCGIPADDRIDWPAAASAYDYYFALMYHFASRFNARYFLMHNEPECGIQWWHLPEDLARIANRPGFHSDVEGKRCVLDALSTEWSVLARIARMAREDAEQAMGAPAKRLFIAGPTNGAWSLFWEKGGRHMDALDYHHYHPVPAAFDDTYRRVAAQAGALAKRTAMSEYGLTPRGHPLSNLLLVYEHSLNLARLMMKVLAPGGAGDPACEYMVLYGLGVPALLRNYYSLVLPDTNLIRWEGLEYRYADADWTDEWIPTLEERQLRFPSPAYHMFRMLARCVPGAQGPDNGYPVLRTGMECLIDDWAGGNFGRLQTVTIDAGDAVYVNFLNPSRQALNLCVDPGAFGDRFKVAVVRHTTPRACDAVVSQTALAGDRIPVTVEERSLTQVILSSHKLDRIESLRIVEDTTTPGTARDLGLFETTRLRALAALDGDQIDVTNLNVIWDSSLPTVVVAYQGGLVQRVRQSTREILVTARTPSGVTAEPVAVPPVDPGKRNVP